MDVIAVIGILIVGLALGVALGWLVAALRTSSTVSDAQRTAHDRVRAVESQRANDQAQAAAAIAERDAMALQLDTLRDQSHHDRDLALQLGPLRQTLTHVSEQVGTLERERAAHFGQLQQVIAQVAEGTTALRDQTASLTGALNSSTTRGSWGETQLRRVLEHSGMLAHSMFDEQVASRTAHDIAVRPDVLIRLPRDKSLVVDAKAPMDAFLQAQAPDLDDAARAKLLVNHAKALRGHVDTLAAKAYWSAFDSSPEVVICFVPSDSVLIAALNAQPELYDHAQRSKVILTSPASLLAVLQATAAVWQQDALADNARQVLTLGSELHSRIGTLGGHIAALGASLNKSVDSYNRMVGTVESRVMVTSRKMHELGVVGAAAAELAPIDKSARRLTQPDLLDHELSEALGTRGASLNEEEGLEVQESDAASAASQRRDAASPLRRHHAS